MPMLNSRPAEPPDPMVIADLAGYTPPGLPGEGGTLSEHVGPHWLRWRRRLAA
jgi:hypothetical protein